MTILVSLPGVQAVRGVFENGDHSAVSETIHLVCHSDTTTGKTILLWDDILAAFKDDVVHVRSGTTVLPFLKGSSFKNLDPLRIASIPGKTLNVVVRSRLREKELSLESLHNALSSTSQENSFASKIPNSNTIPTVRHNLTGGLVEEAMDAYRSNDNPVCGPRLWGPQAILDDPTPPSTSGSTPTSQKSVSGSKTPALQKHASTTDNADGETMNLPKSGDKDAQFAIGNKYYYAQGTGTSKQPDKDMIGFMHQLGLRTPQDYAAARDWYLKAANQGDASGQIRIGHLFEKGLGVLQDYAAAMDWYLKATDQGYAAAQNNIGLLYRHGHSVPQNYSSAMD
ncbi:hypothetical protein BGZ95_004151 [Linnemannia exigua]|uniref:HCP-like protein n=1 Tax=Linnemannia exigua TaxID=604196 RepID=A0AAD4D3D1_9FUNG|nr:hypothetical protein BGZ95_004151 [Linnemannia exigua]